MPVYNNISYLDSAVKSIIAQTYTNWELLLLNDASTEPVNDLLQKYDDPRIIKLENKTNLGLTKSLNICLDRAEGDFIARHDSDDISAPLRFEKEVSLLKNSSADLVSTWAKTIHPKYPAVSPLATYIRDDYADRVTRLKDSAIKDTLLEKNCIFGPAAMFTRKVFDTIGYYDPFLYYSQDYNYWLRVAQYFDIKIIPEILYYRRRNPNSVRADKRHVEKKRDLHHHVKTRAKEFPIINDKEKENIQGWSFNENNTRIVYENQQIYQQAQEFTSHTHDIHSDLPRNTDTIEKMLEFDPSIKNILDAGCREGLLVENLNQRGFNALGVDISSISVNYAKSCGRNVLLCDIHQLTQTVSKKFDAILSVHSLEHCHTPEKVVAEFYDALKEGGIAAVRVPLQRDLVDQSYKTSRTTKGPGGLPAHASKFTPESLNNLLKEAGFEILHNSFHRKGHVRYEEYTAIVRKST